MNGWNRQEVEGVEVFVKVNYTSIEVYIPITEKRFYYKLFIKEGSTDEIVKKAVKEFKAVKS